MIILLLIKIIIIIIMILIIIMIIIIIIIMITIYFSFVVLRKDGFGEHKYFHCVVAESQDHAQRGTLLGFALYFFAYSTWEGKMLYLEDLYVSEQHRGKGMGIALWKSVAKVSSILVNDIIKLFNIAT